MKFFSILPIVLVGFVLSNNLQPRTTAPITEYLNVAGPIDFNAKSYKLSWTSHPSANYYKQEYLPANENADKFESMLMLEALTGSTNPKDLVNTKLVELKKMKASNPVVNYESFSNPETGEYMIDFLLTANGADGKISVAERNVYRYTSFTDKSGNKGVLLFAVATRSYGDAITGFLTALKTNKKSMVDQVSRFKMPVVNILKK